MKILYLLIATLKFLGITILILLLILLLLLAIILLVPIKYNLYLSKSEEISGNASVEWLYSIVGLDIIYNSDAKMIKSFKLFGKVIGPRKSKKTPRPKQIKAKLIKEVDDIYEGVDQEHPKEKIKKSKETEKSKEAPKEKKVQKKVQKEKGGFKEKLDKIRSFTYKKELLTDTLNLIKGLLKHILPSTLYTEIEIGKEDPADTGQLIAGVSAFYPLYYSFATIRGNYEKECFYVKIDASGDITLGKLVYEIIRYIRTTSVKQMIKFIRKDRKGKDHGRKVAK